MADPKNNKENLIICYDADKGTARIELEKRILRRIPIDQDVVVGTNERDLAPCRLVNLSEGGALLNTGLKLKVNQIIELRINENTPPFGRAAVVRVAREGESYGIKWLEFTEDHLPKGFLVRKKF